MKLSHYSNRIKDSEAFSSRRNAPNVFEFGIWQEVDLSHGFNKSELMQNYAAGRSNCCCLPSSQLAIAKLIWFTAMRHAKANEGSQQAKSQFLRRRLSHFLIIDGKGRTSGIWCTKTYYCVYFSSCSLLLLTAGRSY